MHTMQRIWEEFRDDWSVIVVAGFVLSAVLVRYGAPEERKRLRALVFLIGLHLVLVPVAGLLHATASEETYEAVHLVCLIFQILAYVGMGGTILFGVLLPRIRVRAPRILRDLVAAAASIITVAVIGKRAGVSVTGLITTSAVLTAVIGFSLQDTLGNIMGGLALQMDNSIQVGDWIKVGDIGGRVTEIRWRYTAIETRNWETVVIPNSYLMKTHVVVLGRRVGEPLQWRRWVYFNVDFRHAPTDVIAPVVEALRTAPIDRVAVDPAPQCILMDLTDSFGKYAVRYWLTDPGVDDPTDSEVRTRIYFALRRAGIPLSMPAHAVFLTEDSIERKAEKQKQEHERRLAALGRVDLFDSLPPEEHVRLAESLRYAPFTRGEVMTKQGAEAHWLYMIVEGEALVRVTAEGLEREVARIKAGSFFGEMALMTGALRSATVVAHTDVESYRLDKEAFQHVLKDRPEVAEEVAEILARRKVELEAVREGLDEVARTRKLAAAKSDLLSKIQSFFGLEEDHRRVG